VNPGEEALRFGKLWPQHVLADTGNTCNEGHVGCGLQIVTTDLNDDSKIEIAVAGKSGTYLLLAK
jgi:hypothetical protein